MLMKKWDELLQYLRAKGVLTVFKTVFTVVGAILRVALGAAATVFLIGVICAFTFMGTLGDYLEQDVLQDVTVDPEDYSMEQNSYLYYVDSDGEIQEYQQIFAETSSRWATYEEIPKDLVNAAIAIEDHRFYEHQGVDWITTVKACVNMFFGGDSQFGGSTITQQLIKNVTGEKSVTVQRKVMEIFRSQMFEKEYDKDTIIENYLNRISLMESLSPR